MESDFKIAVIGLGIIGGSMAYALHGFRGAKIAGFDTDDETLRNTAESGAIDEACGSASSAVNGADLIIIATYPDSIAEIVRANSAFLKKGAVITDICGVKERISKEIEKALPKSVHYVGSHPMAGKEVEGFIHAEAKIFDDCGFIITLSDASDDESVNLIYEMAEYMGAGKIAVSTPSEHDEIIAYTSDLMHIAACGLCLDFNEKMNLAYTAGAFRDCTRIALINPKLWTELFMENPKQIVNEIDRYMKSLQSFRDAIDNRDEEKLFSLLKRVRENKLDILGRVPQKNTEKRSLIK